MGRENDLLRQALEHYRAGRITEAAESFERVLNLNPSQTDALYALGVIARQSGNHLAAAEFMRRALAIEPDLPDCHHVLGLALMGLRKLDESEACFLRAIALRKAPGFYNSLGILRKEQGRFDEAIAAYQQAIELNPGFADAHYNLGHVYQAKDELAEAAKCFERAANAEPSHVHALAALARVLQLLKRPEESVPHLRKAADLWAGDADLRSELGDALHGLGRFEEAIAEYQKALQLNPKLAQTWFAAGCAESSLEEYVAATACFRKALDIRPGWPEAQHNLGQALFYLGRVDEALELFRQAAASDWLESPPTESPRAALPEGMIAVVIPASPKADNQAILEARRTWAERYLPAPRPAERFAHRVRAPGAPLRLGYVGSFFHRHNWMKPVWGLINQHDRGKFEIHLFSDAAASEIQYGYRQHPGDRFHDITQLTNDEVADRIEQCAIELLVDLNGYSKTPRLPLFALRPAPVIVGWFNMYATSGMRCYDYLIGDDVVIPREEEKFYCEKIVRVPGSYLTFEINYPTPEVVSPPCLARQAITFGCLAPQHKISSDVIAAWSRILLEAPGSMLILKNAAVGSSANRKFVHDQFERHNVRPERIRLEGPADHERFLKAYEEMDVALDTFPYNGGTTTTEAIWQGVPVLTFLGDRWVSRISASILRAANLDEFVCADLEGYVSRAVQMARSPDTPRYLGELRRTMRSRLQSSAACDTQGFARNMERLYIEMYNASR